VTLRVAARIERWPIRREFRIARGAKSSAAVLVVEARLDGLVGRGEAVPYPRYGESPETALAQVAAFPVGDFPVDPGALRAALPAGAAANALDCALWDLEAQLSGRPVWELAALAAPAPVVTAYTIGLAEPEAMAGDAQAEAQRPLLKVKLGGDDAGARAEKDLARLAAVREAAPQARLIVDANEGWTAAQLDAVLAAPIARQLELIEQPLPAAADEALDGLHSPVALGADESVHQLDDLARLAVRYSVLNVKLDKTGGLTRALELVAAARRDGFELMIGCMVATSLAMAPALLLAGDARFVDLDGPLLLARDRRPGLGYAAGRVFWPDGPFWGVPRTAESKRD